VFILKELRRGGKVENLRLKGEGGGEESHGGLAVGLRRVPKYINILYHFSTLCQEKRKWFGCMGMRGVLGNGTEETAKSALLRITMGCGPQSRVIRVASRPQDEELNYPYPQGEKSKTPPSQTEGGAPKFFRPVMSGHPATSSV
jgi:hypothetical protein